MEARAYRETLNKQFPSVRELEPLWVSVKTSPKPTDGYPFLRYKSAVPTFVTVEVSITETDLSFILLTLRQTPLKACFLSVVGLKSVAS